MQKYVHIIESFSCIIQIFVVTHLLPIFFKISFRMCSTPKLSEYVTYYSYIKLSDEFPLIHTHQDLLHKSYIYISIYIDYIYPLC